jgi:hypothetical protein
MRITRRFLFPLLLLLAAVCAPVGAEENFSSGDAQAFSNPIALAAIRGNQRPAVLIWTASRPGSA